MWLLEHGVKRRLFGVLLAIRAWSFLSASSHYSAWKEALSVAKGLDRDLGNLNSVPSSAPDSGDLKQFTLGQIHVGKVGA